MRIQEITKRTIKGMSFGTVFVTQTYRSLFLTEMKKTMINQILKQAVTLKMRLTMILTRRLTCTNNSFLAKLCIEMVANLGVYA